MASILNIHLSKEGTVNILFTEQNLLKPPARALGLDMPDQQARPIPNGLVEVPSSCLILTESSRGKIKDFWLPVPEGLNPMAFGTAVTKAYVQNVGKFRRLYYHCVLFKQPVVSIASLAKVGMHPLPRRPGPCRSSCLRTGVGTRTSVKVLPC